MKKHSKPTKIAISAIQYMISQKSGIPLARLNSAKLTPGEFSKIFKAASEIQEFFSEKN